MYVLSCGTTVQSRGYERKTSFCLRPSGDKSLATYSCSAAIEGCYFEHNSIGCFLFISMFVLNHLFSTGVRMNCTVLLVVGEC